MRVKMPMLHRAGTIEARAGETDEAVRIAISSELPVMQGGWLGDTWFEILEHSAAAVDLARFKRGIPLRVVDRADGSHADGVQVGVIENPEIGPDRVLRGTVRWSRSLRAQEIRQDVLDGIRTTVSVGYRVTRFERDQARTYIRPTDGKQYATFEECVADNTWSDSPEGYCNTIKTGEEGTTPVFRAKRWTPMEASLVPVPADHTVGAGRAVDATYEVDIPEERAMSEPKVETPVAPPPAPPPPVAGGQDAGRERQMKDLAALAKMHDAVAELPGWIERGITLEQAKDELLARARAGAQPRVDPPQDKGVQLSEKEGKEYSLSRAILALADGRRHTLGIEREVSDEIEKRSRDPEVVQARHGAEDRRLYIPHSLPIFAVGRSVQARFAHYFQRGALEVATASKGGELKFIEPGPFIELLRNRMLVRALGARVLTGLRGDISFPRQITAAAASWVPESPTADVGASNLTLDSPDLAPRILQATTSYTRKLLAQGVVDVDMLVRDDFVQVHALAIDLAAIAGLGTSNQPTGILNVSGIGSVTTGANGAAPTYDHFVDLETEVAVDNADIGALAYLTTARVRGRMKKSAAISATTGVPAWFGNEVNGYRAEASQQVPSNLTKGTSTTICHAILFGNWADLLIGYWGDLEIIVDPYSQKKRGDIEVTTYQMCDVTVRHAESFAAVKDALP